MTVQFNIEAETRSTVDNLKTFAQTKPETTGHPLTEEELEQGIRPAIERCATAYEVALGDVTADLSHANAQLDATQSERDDLSARLETCEAEREACEAQAAQANANGRREIARLAAQVAELQQEIETLREGGSSNAGQVVSKRIEELEEHVRFLTARLRSAMSQLGAFEDKAKASMAEWKGRIESLPAMTFGEIEAAFDHAVRKIAAIGTTTEYFTIARMAALLLSPWEEIQDTLSSDEPEPTLSGGLTKK